MPNSDPSDGFERKTLRGDASEDSNVGMKREAVDQFRVLEARLEAALTRLRALLSPAELKALALMQNRWCDYRDSIQDYARVEYEGGTNAALAAGIAKLNATRKRAEEVEQEIERRTRLRG